MGKGVDGVILDTWVRVRSQVTLHFRGGVRGVEEFVTA